MKMTKFWMMAMVLALGLLAGCPEDGETSGPGGRYVECPPTSQVPVPILMQKDQAERWHSSTICPADALNLGFCCGDEHCGCGVGGAIVAWCCEVGVLCYLPCSDAFPEAFNCSDFESTGMPMAVSC